MPRAKGEAVDVVTAPMFDRNATNRQCSTGGLAPDDEYGVDGVRQGNAKGVQGLADFCMAEQRVQPGGVESTAASCGRRVIRTICKEDGRSLGPQRLEFLSRSLAEKHSVGNAHRAFPPLGPREGPLGDVADPPSGRFLCPGGLGLPPDRDALGFRPHF